MEVRNYGRTVYRLQIPDLCEVQKKFYAEFLQADVLPSERRKEGLQAIFEETFPIKSYDEKMSLEFIEYDIGEPRHTPDECRQLGLTYGAPLKVRLRLMKEQPVEEDVYFGNVPLMLGGGEFIINGAERTIVSQIQRSPGADFEVSRHSSGKKLYSCRIIPERGSWIQIETTSKDIIYVRVDRTSRICGTMFLRSLDEKFGTTDKILRAFYPTRSVSLSDKQEKTKRLMLVADVADPDTGEILAKAMSRLTDEIVEKLRGAGVKTVEVMQKPDDDLILNTLAEDDSHSHQEARLKIYARMRPGNPAQIEKANELFKETFFDDKRYNFGRIGRFRLNRKFGLDISEDILTLTAEDVFNCIRYILEMRADRGVPDDIDHLENRRVRTIKDLISDEFRKGMLKMRRAVREKMSVNKDAADMTPRTLVNSQTVSGSIEYFFARGELSQVVDQSNPLSQLTHERRLSALGPGGLNRKRAGFEVRDVHPSHYGRICPIETPEGTNIGLIVSLGIYASINDYGFIVTPYAVVKNGKVTGEVVYLRADEEKQHTIAQAGVEIDPKTGKILADKVNARQRETFVQVPADQVTLMDVAPRQIVGVAASLIPFLEHDDANRALMGSNMQRQAVPLLRPEPPIVSTGMEEAVARNSGMVVVAEEDGVVQYADGERIVLKTQGGTKEYVLRKYFGLNERTCLNQIPIVKAGQRVAKGDVLTEGAATRGGSLALGRDVLVAFMSWEGLNFEDAILVSERLLKKDAYTSVHIEEFEVEIRETKLGREEITRDIPNVSEAALANLDDDGLVRVGTRVKPGDILVGKIAPKSKSELSSEEKLLHAIFGRSGEDVKNDSREVKPGCEGYVIDVKRFRRVDAEAEGIRADVRREIRRIETEIKAKLADVIREKFAAIEEAIGGKPRDIETGRVFSIPRGASPDEIIELDKSFSLSRTDMKPAARRKAQATAYRFDKKKRVLEVEMERKVGKLKRGDELQPGVLEMVKVYVAVKRRLSVGDKMAGRHGNKGVVSRILPEEDMPFLEDGTPVDIVLNPLGVPSRMNFGQILETHLGLAAKVLGFRAVTPVFDGAKEHQIVEALKEADAKVKEKRERYEKEKKAPPWNEFLADIPSDGKMVLYDGRTGEPFEQKVTVGYIYMMKLHHLVADKIHARATGPYSLITQQPLGGKARSGGQRFGEMEVWALEAYGAANVLQELLTVKSDDVDGRTKIYESMVKGENVLEPGTPVSFEVLCNEIRGLGLNVKLEKAAPALP